jgi:competence protein ComGC
MREIISYISEILMKMVIIMILIHLISILYLFICLLIEQRAIIKQTRQKNQNKHIQTQYKIRPLFDIDDGNGDDGSDSDNKNNVIIYLFSCLHNSAYYKTSTSNKERKFLNKIKKSESV